MINNNIIIKLNNIINMIMINNNIMINLNNIIKNDNNKYLNNNKNK